MKRAANRSAARDVVAEYCKQYRTLPSLTLARKIIAEHPALVSNLRNANNLVRRVRGLTGKGEGGIAEVPTPTPRNARSWRAIPRGIRQVLQPFRVPTPSRVLVLSDLHVPFHDRDALVAAIEYGLSQKCDSVYLNGDSLDFYSLSRFVKDPRMRDPFEEVAALHGIMSELEDCFPKRYFKAGNHDERWDIALYQCAPWLVKFKEASFARVMQFESRGWEFIESKQRAKIGHLNILHGHEATRGLAAPVNPARGVWLKIKATALVGHWHTPSQHTETQPLEQSVVASWSTGCLCDLEPAYAPINNWAHGFAIVESNRSGDFRCQNFRILNGKDVYPA